jgi:putative ABC transport system substrate-binding protein
VKHTVARIAIAFLLLLPAAATTAHAQATGKVCRIGYILTVAPSEAEHLTKTLDEGLRELGYVEGRNVVEVRGSDEIEGAFATMARERVDALVVLPDPITFTARSQVVLLAAKHRLPVVYWQREYVDAGGLMSYGSDLAHQFRRAAVYVDKILKGAKPGDLPVEQAATFELVINLKTAKALGLGIPPSLQLRANHLIE